MTMKRSKGNNNKKSIFLGLILLLLALGLFLFEDQDTPTVTTQPNFRSKETQDLVNRHLRETTQDIVLRQQKAAIDSKREILNSQKSGPQRKFDYNPQRLEITNYDENPTFNQELGRGVKGYDFPQDPSQIVQSKLFQDQTDEKYSEQYKKEYVRQFVENARNAGWDIKVDASYRVISAKPIQRAPAYNILQGTGEGSH